MSDIYDQASDIETMHRERAIQAARNSTPTLNYIGCCYNCEAVLDQPLTFCDADCRDDWQIRNPRTPLGKQGK